MIEITSNEFGALNTGLTVIDFYAPWCGPCKMLKPILEKLDAENDWFDVYMMDTDKDDNYELMSDLGIRAVPTLKFYKDGKEVESLSGFVQPNKILEVLNKYK